MWWVRERGKADVLGERQRGEEGKGQWWLRDRNEGRGFGTKCREGVEGRTGEKEEGKEGSGE